LRYNLRIGTRLTTRYRSYRMSTFTSLTYHVVFGTKLRRPLIRPEIRDHLYAYIGGIIRDEKGHLIEVGGMPDHIHILASFSPTVAVSVMLRQIKTGSSKWLNERPDVIDRFEWQRGYGAFTVSQSGIGRVRRYIQGQEEHHQKRSFSDEFVRLLQRHQIPFEERYLFDGEHHG
jgi:putative transposase